MSETEQPADDIPDGFVRENRQHVRALVESLVPPEGEAPDGEAVDAAFRAAHSLKANCEMEGLDDAAAVAHAVEDVLAAARAGDGGIAAEAADEVVGAVEAIERVLDGIGSGEVPSIDADGWTERLHERLDDGPGTNAGASGGTDADAGARTDAGEPPALDDLDLDEEARRALEAADEYDDLDALVAAMDDGAEAYADLEGGGSFGEVESAAGAASTEADADAEVEADDDAEGGIRDADSIDVESDDCGETDAADSVEIETDTGDTPMGASVAPDSNAGDPAATDADTAEPVPDPEVAPRTTPSEEAPDATDAVVVPGVGRVTDAAGTIAASSLDAAAFGATGEAPTEEAPAGAADTTVAPSRLDAVRSLAVEQRRLAATLDDDPDGRAADALASLRAATEHLEVAAVGDLRRLDAVVPKLERAVERADRSVETPVAFEATVAPVAVDRPVVDRLSEPLVHLVRNAVDHGIEAPRERGAAGKPRTGTVAVRARRDGGHLVVSVADDGRGIDPDAVRAAAIEAGIDGTAHASDDRVLDLLFEAGLSTADPDSDLSGRGVGMDVVERTMSDLGGEVDVDSTPGEGTTVRLSVPVDGVVERIRLVAVGAERFAVPAGAVAEVVPASEATAGNGTVRVPTDELERDAMGTATAFGSTREYPAVDLGRALSVPGSDPEPAGAFDATPDRADPAYLLVDSGDGAASGPRAETGGTDDHVALRCDGLVGTHETLVTPLAGVAAAPSVDGVVVCDAGRVVPVLDPRELADGR